MLIPPHGGKLVNRIAAPAEVARWRERAAQLPSLVLNERELSDLEMLAVGTFSPLDGFMTAADYRSVRDECRLASGVVWSLPVTLSTDSSRRAELAGTAEARLETAAGQLVGIIEIEDVFPCDKELEAAKVLRTTDAAHPGVAYLQEIGDLYVGGRITLLERPPREAVFERHRLDPKESRFLFNEKGWSRIVAFQTRNPVHRAHEYLQKCAMELADALLLHPLVGATKAGDIPADVRMECYRVLLEKYYPADRAVMSVFPAAMRYAGPREAIFHALCRKNYGCSHFIVGRDHAGVGDYYGTYDAQAIFDEFAPHELGVTPLCFEHSFYCKACAGMASFKTCPHGKAERVILSGTKVREMLARGETPPLEFTRPEVAAILMKAMRQ